MDTKEHEGSRRTGWGVAWLLVAALVFGYAIPGVGAAEHANLPGNYTLDVWQVEDGLPGNTVTTIAQTPDGYLWIGTFQGLVRFDGLRFTVFDSTTPGLPSERATRLFVDRAGTLWVTMEYGEISRWANGRFTPLGSAEGWPGLSVKWMASSARDTLLVTVGKDDFGPRALLEYGGGRFRDVMSSPALAPELAAKRDPIGDTVVEVDTTGRWWVVKDRRLGTFAEGQWQAWAPPDGGAAPSISRIAASPKGGLWVCAEGRIRRLVDGRWSTESPSFDWPRENVVMELMEDSEGQLWVGSWGKGLMLGRTDGSTIWFTTKDGFPGNTANCVFEDRERNLWVGTTAGGLVRLRQREFVSHGAAQGLSSQAAQTVVPVGAGDEAWAGASASGLWHLANGRFLRKPLPGVETEATVRTVCVARDGSVWAGLHGNNLYRFQGERMSRYGREQGMSHEVLYTLSEDREGNLWIGGDKGLSRFDGKTFTTLGRADGLTSDRILSLVQDRAGDLWAGTGGGGLNRIRDGKVQRAYDRRDGLPHDTVRTLLADDDGTLWIGTSGGGLCRLRDGRLTTISARDGLPGNDVSAVVDDGLGFLWLASNRGVFRVARSELEGFASGLQGRVDGVTYLPSDGLASLEPGAGSPVAARDAMGRLWFAMVKGVSVVEPRRLRSNPVPPPAVIEEVWLDGVLKFANLGGTGGTAYDAEAGPLVIPPGMQRLEIRYTGLSHVAAERVQFRHRLEGLDGRWENAGPRRTATYHLLAPGPYRFQVMARNNDGVWNPASAALEFRVLPAWWQTAWFRGALALAVVGGAVAAYRIRIRALTRARVMQEDFSRKLIASQEAERQRIARELHDSLGQNLLVIKSRVALAQQQASQPERLADQLAEAASMTSQAIREVREISQNLRPFQLDELGLTQAIVAMVRKLSAASSIRFDSDVAELSGALVPEYEINLYRVLQECLNNVVKHSQATACRLSVVRSSDRIVAEVEDDGRGMNERDGSDAGDGGFGLSGIRERMRTLGGTVEFEARPGGGTRVVVFVPLAAGRG